MNLKQIFAAWQPGAPPADREKWFSQAPIFLPIIGIAFAYPLIAAFNSTLLGWIDVVLSPTVDALRWIGMGIDKPPMDGPFPTRFYLNETGIVVWGAVIYNAITFAYLIIKRRPMSRNPEKALQRLIEKHRWGRVRAWFAVRSAVFLFGVPFAAYCTACLLNGIHGWFVFHIDEYSAVALPLLVFVLPGALAGMMWLAIAEYFFYDCMSLVKFISCPFKSQ